MSISQREQTRTLTVLLPVHNGMPYLPATMESVFAQTFTDFEVVVVDDGSTDDTATYLKALSDPRVRYFRLEKVGLVGALNYGLEKSRGKLIARLDGDDLCQPDRLADQLAYFQAHPKCVLLGCDFDEIDGAGSVVGINPYNVTQDAALRWLLHFGTPFLHPGVMYPLNACRQAGGYSTRWDVAEDYDLWTRLSCLGPVASLSKRLMRKRIHPNAVSVAKRARGLQQSSEIAAEHSLRHGGLSAAVAADLYWLFNTGEIKASSTPYELAAEFVRRREAAERNLAAGEELVQTIQYVGRSLAYASTRLARASLRRPRSAAAWLAAARTFEPGRPILKRAFQKLFGTAPQFDPMNDRVVKA